MTTVTITQDVIDELIGFIIQEVKKGTPKNQILATVELILDKEAQKTIEEGERAKGKVFPSSKGAIDYP
ncbi:MAG: hypothetical protein ACUVWK_01810 [Nitrososphaerales archaeon]